jgi:hypothetical protein
MLGHPMRPPVLMTLLLLAAPDAFAQKQEVPRTLPVGRLMAPSGTPEPRTIGPGGTLGPEVYRRRRKAVMDKLPTGATLVVNEAHFEGLREGMDFYYLTGIDEPGAALLLDPGAPETEVLFLRTLDVERGQWDGERAKLPSTALETTTGIAGDFRFTNLPFNTYHLTVNTPGFSNYAQDVDVRSSVPAAIDISLKVGTTSENITVEATGADLVETESTPHTDVDRELFDKLPLESASSSLSSLVTLASPGVVADSNGLFHGLGDHAENSFSVDGQAITDQQSKVFSNQLPVDSIQSMEVISGAPPAEYGDKTSLVIKVTTRSGFGQTQPTGSLTTSYGSFNTRLYEGRFHAGAKHRAEGGFEDWWQDAGRAIEGVHFAVPTADNDQCVGDGGRRIERLFFRNGPSDFHFGWVNGQKLIGHGAEVQPTTGNRRCRTIPRQW